MAITATDILFKLSIKTGTAGNQNAQSDVNASLGKYISTTQITDATLNNLFDDVSGDENAASDVEYRCIFVHNAHATLTWQSVVVWLSAEVSGGANAAIAVDDVAASAIGSSSAQADEVANESTAPTGEAFSSPTTKATGLSIGLPNLPGSISDSIRKITVLFFAPTIETFWIVAVYAILVTLIGKTIWAVLAQAGVFSLAHTSSYILGFYSYPSWVTGFSAFQQNLGSFISAFIFAFIGMYILIQKKIQNQIFLITLHFLLNLIITVLLAIIIIS